jgi:gas vesicle protein
MNIDFIKGVLVGGILGGIAGVLAAPKSGEELREDLSENYDCLKGKCKGLKEKTQYYANALSEKVRGSDDDEEEPNHKTPFLVGGTLGALTGAVAAALLAPHAGKKLRKILGEKAEDLKETDWKDFLGSLVENLSSTVSNEKVSNTVNEIAQWANLGLNVLQGIKKGRR